ncbi:hypothetical protein C8Q72DRAFT_181168 [Fomitopsis betulina]|nr:hypothetical protein C8Q72DRAFT_181168 [Fomitopsis betulina]
MWLVSRWFNIPYKAGSWVGMLAILCGAVPFVDPKILFNGQEAIVPIRPEYLKRPLFIAGRPGGRELVTDNAGIPEQVRPQTAKSISHKCLQLALTAGLPPTGMHGWRRGSLDDYAMKMNSVAAATIATHAIKENNVINNVYARGITNILLTAIRLGELETDASDVQKAALLQNEFICVAVKCLTKCHQIEAIKNTLIGDKPRAPIKRSTELSKLTPDQESAIENSDEVKSAAKDMSLAWDCFFWHFPPLASKYCEELTLQRNRLNAILEHITPLPLSTSEQVSQAKGLLETCIDKYYRLQKKHANRVRKQNKASRSALEANLGETIEERDNAVAKLRLPIASIQDVADSAKSGNLDCTTAGNTLTHCISEAATKTCKDRAAVLG